MISNTQKLIEDIKNGVPLSFNSVYSVYYPLITSLAEKYRVSFSLSESEADDLRQEAAIALYDAALSFSADRGVTFGLYAKICIKNRLVSYIRGSTGKSIRAESLEETDEASLLWDDNTPEQIIVDRESVSDVKNSIISYLTPLERSVFDLYLAGASYKDISAAIGISEKSTDNAIQRIKAKLKRLL